ncbi:Isoprenylcysteine carboxyl methyltransferase family-domain-containing protein [Lipomyces chichibuensis]|uniref:Isoprenylcysteine carboxyl methyltransferase family-domain-containing protein n=1 Tax=Lipomyces chichibuensis TaxID=1546026 RepID=UPI0033441094
MTAPPPTTTYTASTTISSINQENTPPADDQCSFSSAKVSQIAAEIEANNEQREIFLRQRLQEKQHQQKTQAEIYIYNYVNHKPDEVALHSFILGILLAISVVVAARLLNDGLYYQLPAYVASLAAFHFLEYWITARYNPSKVTIDSFLFRNGSSYFIAHSSALMEATIEWAFFGNIKKHIILSAIGFALMVFGQILRSMAMIHASSNFSHVIVHHKEDSHRLVTTGVYSFTRHPSYLGYFWWAIGTQLFLVNPVASVGFAIILWRFFNNRIQYEEKLLIEFFGDKYIEYKKSTGTLIPFIK